MDFYAFFGCVGLFNAGFLFIYAALDASKVMRWSTSGSVLKTGEGSFANFSLMLQSCDPEQYDSWIYLEDLQERGLK
ncbi:unnamed protein product [Dibothriocephalus latus]|uniref:Uncharacterized protein n=1 Tax=Dibothriocephalus latus TaxID=60516 RepID=A0A3P7P376_DIBLA|nr:unnamed protein product [Dibothriocephalus latus]